MAAQNNGPHQAQQQPAMDNPDMVGSQFVNQYYTVMKSSPKYLHRFYNDNSTFTFVDPGHSGSPSPYSFTARSQKTIHDQVMGLGFDACGVDLFTVDSQFSHNRGVTVLVTGALTFMDGRRRPFVQSFFLAAQERGFYVLNDVFRYLGEAAIGKLQGSQHASASASGRPQEGTENGHPPGPRGPSQQGQEQANNPQQRQQQQQHQQQPQPNGLPAPPQKLHEAPGGAAAQQAPQEPPKRSQSPTKPQPQEAAAQEVQQGAGSQPAAPMGPQSQAPPASKEMPVFTAPVSLGQNMPESHAVRPLSERPSQQPAPKPNEKEAAEPTEAAGPEAEAAEESKQEPQESKSQAPSAPLTYAERLKQGRKEAAAPPPPSPAPSAPPQQPPQGQSRDASPAPAGQREASALHPADSQGSSSAQGPPQGPSGRGPPQAPHEEPANTSIFVRQLPPEVTPEQIEQAFARYGPVKGGARGVSIKGAKGRDIFAFVEFEAQAGMQGALEGSTEMEGQRLLVVEKKPWLMNRGGRGFMGRGGGRGDGPRGGFRGRMDSRGPPPGRGRGGFPSDIGGRYQGGRGGRGNEGRGREFGRRGGRDGA